MPFTESEALGVSRDPWDPRRTPGGSSSGAGVAVAAGMAPLAHPQDGGGSIRIPASCNGLVGLKPTRGLVPHATVEVEGLATSGVLTHGVADTAAALDVLVSHDPGAWWSPPARCASFVDGEDPSAAVRNSYPMGVFMSLFDVTGQPAISLPVHHDPATGLPVGVQIVAAPWRGEFLLQVAHVIERALPWAGRRPPSADRTRQRPPCRSSRAGATGSGPPRRRERPSCAWTLAVRRRLISSSR
ncbi:amidase family protein [Streptomyces sp. NPDC096046]|uniref:amidase family protein n=1 Tax=Streptomyces sp. NPDC096046 TaxID=3155542 RepID=UPI00331CF138